MKKLTLLTFILISTFAKANAVEDSLIANIGKKAKVIFYAENKADFNEIAKYDLNKLFAEVRKRSEKNFSNNEEVTLREADDLKNREVNTTVSTKKWLKNMNLNLFVGASPFTSVTKVVGPAYLFSNSTPQMIAKGVFEVENRNTLMIGIGSFYTKKLYEKRNSQFSLIYGLGLDLLNTKLSIKNTGNINTSDTVFEVYGERNEKQTNHIFSTNFYAQLMPTFDFINKKGQKTVSFGIGFKAATNLSNITFNEYLNDRRKGVYIKNSPAIRVTQPTFQTAIIANIGYKFVNAFFQVIPNHSKVESRVFSSTFPFDEANNQTKNTYTIGLRFGK